MISRFRDDPVGPAIVRILAGTGTGADEAELQRWLAGSPDRTRQLEELRVIWTETGALQRKWDTTTLQRRILRVVNAEPSADAAVIPRHAGGSAPRLKLWPAFLARRPRAWLPAASAAVVLLAIGVLGWWTVARRARRDAGRQPMVAVMTPPGRQATFWLPDGTRGVLRGNSRLRYAKAFAAGMSRDVYLEGEAYFEVAHDTTRAFVVHAGRAVTRVLGTRFGVRAYATDRTVQVVVAEGKVGLGREAAIETILSGGDLGTLGADDRVVVRRGVATSSYLAWVDSELVFTDTPVGEAIPEVFRQYDLNQEDSMRLLNRSIAGLGLALALPAAARAQSVKLADLVGTWVATSKTGWVDTLIIRPDSTFTDHTSGEGEKIARFTGDSIMFAPNTLSHKVKLQDQQLTLTSTAHILPSGASIPGGMKDGEKVEFVAKRVDTPKTAR